MAGGVLIGICVILALHNAAIGSNIKGPVCKKEGHFMLHPTDRCKYIHCTRSLPSLVAGEIKYTPITQECPSGTAVPQALYEKGPNYVSRDILCTHTDSHGKAEQCTVLDRPEGKSFELGPEYITSYEELDFDEYRDYSFPHADNEYEPPRHSQRSDRARNKQKIKKSPHKWYNILVEEKLNEDIKHLHEDKIQVSRETYPSYHTDTWRPKYEAPQFSPERNHRRRAESPPRGKSVKYGAYREHGRRDFSPKEIRDPQFSGIPKRGQRKFSFNFKSKVKGQGVEPGFDKYTKPLLKRFNKIPEPVKQVKIHKSRIYSNRKHAKSGYKGGTYIDGTVPQRHYRRKYSSNPSPQSRRKYNNGVYHGKTLPRTNSNNRYQSGQSNQGFAKGNQKSVIKSRSNFPRQDSSSDSFSMEGFFKNDVGTKSFPEPSFSRDSNFHSNSKFSNKNQFRNSDYSSRKHGKSDYHSSSSFPKNTFGKNSFSSQTFPMKDEDIFASSGFAKDGKDFSTQGFYSSPNFPKKTDFFNNDNTFPKPFDQNEFYKDFKYDFPYKHSETSQNTNTVNAGEQNVGTKIIKNNVQGLEAKKIGLGFEIPSQNSQNSQLNYDYQYPNYDINPRMTRRGSSNDVPAAPVGQSKGANALKPAPIATNNAMRALKSSVIEQKMGLAGQMHSWNNNGFIVVHTTSSPVAKMAKSNTQVVANQQGKTNGEPLGLPNQDVTSNQRSPPSGNIGQQGHQQSLVDARSGRGPSPTDIPAVQHYLQANPPEQTTANPAVEQRQSNGKSTGQQQRSQQASPQYADPMNEYSYAPSHLADWYAKVTGLDQGQKDTPQTQANGIYNWDQLDNVQSQNNGNVRYSQPMAKDWPRKSTPFSEPKPEVTEQDESPVHQYTDVEGSFGKAREGFSFEKNDREGPTLWGGKQISLKKSEVEYEDPLFAREGEQVEDDNDMKQEFGSHKVADKEVKVGQAGEGSKVSYHGQRHISKDIDKTPANPDDKDKPVDPSADQHHPLWANYVSDLAKQQFPLNLEAVIQTTTSSSLPAPMPRHPRDIVADMVDEVFDEDTQSELNDSSEIAGTERVAPNFFFTGH